jgi:hypothetical protein
LAWKDQAGIDGPRIEATRSTRASSISRTHLERLQTSTGLLSTGPVNLGAHFERPGAMG